MHGLSMKDWRGRRAVSFNINSSGVLLYKGKGQTLSQVGFAMTINKSQGQTLPHVGLFQQRPVFLHDQLYVVVSRVKKQERVEDDYLSLKQFDKEKYLEQPIPAAPVAAAPNQLIPLADLATYNEWVKNQKEIAVMMLLTIDLEIQQNLAHLGANDILKELKALYSKQAEQELLQTVIYFHTCKQEEGQSISSYVLKMKSYIDQLERLGHPVTLNLEVSLILVGLSKEYDSFVQNYNMHNMGKTINELHTMLKIHEETLSKKVVAPALHVIRAGKVQKNKNKKPSKAAKGVQGRGNGKMANANVVPSYAPKPKNPPSPKKDNPAKDAICHHCGEVGHWRRNCPTYLTELLKKKHLAQGASTSGMFTIELYSFPSTSWVYDTGCSTYICNTTQGLWGSKKLNPGALSLYMGNGQRAAVEAIRNYHLCLPSRLVIVLNNCHYAPSITRGIISVSRLYEDGFINRYCFIVSERRNRTLLDMVRSMMSQTTLPKSFWDYALESAACILNMVPTKKVDKTPYEIWLLKKGYLKETIGYSFYNPSKSKVFVAQNTEFFESNLIDQEASGSLEDLEIIQEDTNPSLDTSLNHEEDDQEIDEPQSDINPIYRSTRTKRALDHMCLYNNAEEHELEDLGEPANYKAALLDPESKK
ncbi:zinc finger, CCHC-type containing protein [Tanacetum coccineum]